MHRPLHPRFRDPLVAADNPDFDYAKTSISEPEGEFLWSLIRENGFRKTIEVGCALGVSSLYICDALSEVGDASHTMVDPNQTEQWQKTGVKNLEEHGFDCHTLIEKPSEIALPELLEAGESYDFAFIDGWHTFDHTLLDFFYMNRMVRVGGMIVFDDATWPAIAKLIRYIERYPCYEKILPPGEGPPSIVAFKKTEDDERRYDWFAPF